MRRRVLAGLVVSVLLAQSCSDAEPAADPSAPLTTPSTQFCSNEPPSVFPQVGTVNTIVVPPNAGDFTGEVLARPPGACAGDEVRFAITVTNISDRRSEYEPGRGLLLRSGGMANWALAPLDSVELAPGETWTTTVIGTIPPVQPGTYRLSAEGVHPVGGVTVLESEALD